MKENQVSGYLYNELFSESNEEKCTAFQSIAWSLIVHKNTIKNCSTTLLLVSFSLFVCFISSKGKNTSAILQPSVQHVVYDFPIVYLHDERELQVSL